jgi:UDP-N-acetylglucosamine/UDP-N-acetylgalactosamine 4-epimerase
MGDRWLVTGAAGFIGSHLVEELLGRGETVVGLDSFATGRPANVDDALAGLSREQRARFELVSGDIRSPEDCAVATRGATYVLHQAALGSVARSIEDPRMSNEVNVGGFINVLLAARDAGVRRVVYASSGAVYGDSTAEVKREGEEGRPLSPYAATKRANEDCAAAFTSSYGMEVVGLRYFNVYGPRQDPHGQYASVIPRWSGRLLAGEPCLIFGDGAATRDFIYVADVVAANIAAATGEVTTGVFNIGSGRGTQVRELYPLMREIAARTTGRREIEQLEPRHEASRPGEVSRSTADTTRAATELGFMANTALRDGLGKTIRWHAARIDYQVVQSVD